MTLRQYHLGMIQAGDNVLTPGLFEYLVKKGLYLPEDGTRDETDIEGE